MAAPVSLSCAAGPGIDRATAETICGEFLGTLREHHPDRAFRTDATLLPRLDLTLTVATDRAIGARAVWTLPDGSRSEGQELRRVFHDRSADPASRKRFFTTFLDQNPLPF